MTPDIEELIKKVNTLTLDKTRLKQKLAQLNQGNNRSSPKEALHSLSILSQSSTSTNSSEVTDSTRGPDKPGATVQPPSATVSTGSSTTVSSDSTASCKNGSPTGGGNVIGGVECASSCEEDLLFMNELLRKRLDEYSENWDYIESKCSALLSELTALQKHYSTLKKEKLELEEKLKCSCDENDKIKSELQTVVVNYETQLSAMSEHLTMVASQVSMGDL